MDKSHPDGYISKKIVIIGGGFAGINLALQLKNNPHFSIILVDKNNYNFFPPLIYQVATGFLETSSISYPFRKLFRKYKNLSFRLGEFKKVDTATNTCYLSNGEIRYDWLVFAGGCETNYFGMENVRKRAIPMKTVSDALEMRNMILQRLEQAVITTDPAERKKLLTLVVAGGGPTGVEVSGMFAELRKFSLRKDYPELQGTVADIYLVDGGSALLAPMSRKSQEDTYKSLLGLGVIVKLHTHVKDFVDDKVMLDNDEFIETKTLIWAAGITAKVYEGIPAGSYGRGKRMIVDGMHQVKETENVFAIGDASIQDCDPAYPDGHPQVAQVAIQQGKHLASYFKALIDGRTVKPFTYRDKGTMAIIGRNRAVADIPRPPLHFQGYFALLLWLFVHLMSLINYRNRLKTLYNWTVAYLTRDQSLRFIVRPSEQV
jgi:NADH:ubiquinone reductase (H+-translocating)